MDIKVRGITAEIMRDAMAQAREGRMFIMGKMLAAITEPATELSPYAPRVTKIKINPDRIRDIIGPGGKMIRKIIDETKMHHRHPGRRHGPDRLQQRRERAEGDRLDREADQGRRGRRRSTPVR